MDYIFIFLVILCLIYGAIHFDTARAEPVVEAAADSGHEPSMLAGPPLDFVENRGQWDASVKFMARKGARATSFERDAIKLHFGKDQQTSLGLSFEGASRGATLSGEGKRSGHYNFFIGNDPSKWRSKIAAYDSLLYRGLYDGVDMRVREAGEQLEYDLILAAGTDVAKLMIRADGVSGLDVAGDGSLILRTGAGSLRQTPPVTWEELPNGERRPIECRFRKIDARRYGFEVIGRDRNLPLVIDPGLEWATYLGGGNWDEIHDIASAGDGTGDVIAVGATTSSTPVTISAAYGGVTRTTTLTVTSPAPPPPPPPSTDTVAVQVAEYSSGNRQLRVEATSSNASATLKVHVSSTNALIGTLRNEGGGRYRGDFSWSSNPQSITVRSSSGGSATRAIAAK